MLVVGSGIAGLTAALTASQGGSSVLVVEKAKVYGGTSAYSEGMVWAPLSRQAQAAGISDSVDAAIQYLSETAPGYVDEARTRSYVENAPRALAFVEDLTCVRYELTSGSMDYQPDAAGATKGKRALTPRPVHGGELGDLINVLRLPLQTTMIFGTMSVAAEDLPVYYRPSEVPVCLAARRTAVCGLCIRPPARIPSGPAPHWRQRRGGGAADGASRAKRWAIQ